LRKTRFRVLPFFFWGGSPTCEKRNFFVPDGEEKNIKRRGKKGTPQRGKKKKECVGQQKEQTAPNLPPSKKTLEGTPAGLKTGGEKKPLGGKMKKEGIGTGRQGKKLHSKAKEF